MDVFVKEPLVDWNKFARRLISSYQTSSSSTSSSSNSNSAATTAQSITGSASQGDGGDFMWYPREKLRVCRMKLGGSNPALITTRELSTSVHVGKPFLPSLNEIVAGVQGENVRADPLNLPHCPTVQDQIACLIDMATDPNLLGRAYAGWSPWV